MDVSKLKFDQNGLIPAIIQDNDTQQVLMLGWMNITALEKTLETGLITFWSRSRKKLWTKGETSGNYLSMQKMFVDCDQDSLLFLAKPAGPTCHTGNTSCFYTEINYQK
ncbi:MAG: phosphoribosyl-AMP cyclohydrolase [Anaerolineaceae bacterium]|nr:phosphoribosyl-AMP cyclohydrolase [Anaerolineaceae bacterium]